MIQARPTTSAVRPSAVRVLVVDDHELFRRGIIELLQERGIEVVGEAALGADAIRQASELGPGVVLMDLSMPGMSGIEATQRMAAAAPLTRVLVLTMMAEDEYVMNALLAGACGYMLKDAPIDQIVDGIQAAARGESMISPRIASRWCIGCASLRARARARRRADDVARARGAGAALTGLGQRRHRAGAVPQSAHRQEPRLEHPHQASGREPHSGGRPSRPRRHGLRP